VISGETLWRDDVKFGKGTRTSALNRCHAMRTMITEGLSVDYNQPMFVTYTVHVCAVSVTNSRDNPNVDILVANLKEISVQPQTKTKLTELLDIWTISIVRYSTE
jgi:hypothetical protein